MELQAPEIIIIVIILAILVGPAIRRAISSGSSSKKIQKPQPSVPLSKNKNGPAPTASSITSKRQSNKTKAPIQIFISYRRSDSADIAGRIYDRLIGNFEKDTVFKDVDSIPLGIDFKEYLDKQVGECNILLAVIGDSWINASDSAGRKRLDDPTDFVRIEIESALERNIPVIPLLVRGASMTSEDELPPSLRKLVFRNGILIRPDPDFHRDMDRLISALEKYVG